MRDTLKHNLKQTLKLNLVAQVTDSLDDLLQRFLAIMPESYFETNDESTVLQHLSAILLANISGNQDRIMLENQDASRQTYIHFGSFTGLLSDILDQIPVHKSIQQARVYTADNNELIIDVFDFHQEGVAASSANTALRNELIAQMESNSGSNLSASDRSVARAFIQSVNENYLARYDLTDVIAHSLLTQQVHASLDAVAQIHPVADAHHLIDIAYAAGQVDSTNLFTRLARYFCTQDLDIRETFVENFDVDSSHQRALVVLQVVQENPDSVSLSAIEKDIKRLPYLDQAVLDIAFENRRWSLLDAEILIALCHITDQMLTGVSDMELSREVIVQNVRQYDDLALALCDLVKMRFDSARSAQFYTAHAALFERIKNDVADSKHALLLKTVLKTASHLLKSNLYAEQRYCLALRLDPILMVSAQRSQKAYGIFYFFGKAFDGFHVRFEDIARGGVRIVQPDGLEQYAIEAKYLFDEAYQLASAQQLKNKDIPEGGSKGVILVKPSANRLRCGKSYVDGLLDLILDSEDTRARRLDYYDKPELIFLGPDENVSDEMINWIIARAALRQYVLPNSFMSSKPGAGINHKEYGVTSEGVNVFLLVGLRNQGIDPLVQPFTIKITGGPDGDVAGNLIKILHRDYGDNAIIIGIADGGGSAEDPCGLDHAELLRLVQHSLSISHFDKTRLSQEGRVLSIQDPGGVEARNSLHFRLISDVFVPAGGRPAALNENNVHRYLSEEGTPASRLIVEGANLFLTPAARERLTAEGVDIVKDSSANKCGVICSSFEIAAGMMLNEAAFLQIKETFVDEVKLRLRELALLEAQTLFREAYFRPEISLARLSMMLSQEIITITDMIAQQIESGQIPASGVSRQFMTQFFPDSLWQAAGEGALERLPASYFIRAMASILASRIVYHEGLRQLESLPRERLKQHLIAYLQQEEITTALVQQINESKLEDKATIARLLTRGATGTALKWR